VGCRLVSRLALAFAARGLVVDDLHQPPQRSRGTTFMSVAPWIKSYPRGVRWDAELTTMPLQQILERSAAKWPDNPALDFMNRKISYRDLSDLSDRAAKGFQRLGVRPGIHVGLYLPNTPHYVIAFFGVMKAGGTVVNYSPLDAEAVLEHKVDDSETDILVTLDLKALYPQMGRLLETTRLKTLIVGNLAEMTAAPEAVRAHMSKNGEIATVPKDSKHVTFEELLNNDGKYVEHPIADLRESVAVLQYTGGTTGLPKGAMLTHANLSSATAQYVETTHTQPQLLDEGRERILAVLPTFHIYALTVNMLLGIRIGAEMILHTRFDAAAVVKDICEKKVTVFPGVPTMYVAIINHPGVENLDLSSIKWCASGGAPLPLEVQKRFQHISGCRLAEGWGMTETSPRPERRSRSDPIQGSRKPISARRRRDAGSRGSARLLRQEPYPAGRRYAYRRRRGREPAGKWRLDDMLKMFPNLAARADTAAGVLSGGEKQMLTICRTLMGDPELVMIDEPTEGLAPLIVQQVGDLIAEIARRGVAILLVEQRLSIAMRISHRVYVMGHGRIVFEGTPAELTSNDAVRKEWLEV
jgi:acyl-CoA synthetase (AMP-forming)/AMP-acid ligase II